MFMSFIDCTNVCSAVGSHAILEYLVFVLLLRPLY